MPRADHVGITNLWGIVTTSNTRSQMVCAFIDTHCNYTPCIMRSLRRSSWCYWWAVECDGRVTVVEVGWRRCCLKDCWECCYSLGLAQWEVLFSEHRWSQRVDPACSHLSPHWPAPVPGYIATSRMCHANALLEMYVLTCPRQLGNCGVLRSEVTLQLTVSRSIGMSWRWTHLGTCDQLLILFEFRCVVFVGRPLWREVGSVSRQSLSAITVHCQFSPLHFTHHTFYVYTIRTRPSQPRLLLHHL
jgi:hypothetical protein